MQKSLFAKLPPNCPIPSEACQQTWMCTMIDGQKTFLIKKRAAPLSLCLLFTVYIAWSCHKREWFFTWKYFSDSHIVGTCDNVLASSVYDLFYMKLPVYFQAGYAVCCAQWYGPVPHVILINCSLASVRAVFITCSLLGTWPSICKRRRCHCLAQGVLSCFLLRGSISFLFIFQI